MISEVPQIHMRQHDGDFTIRVDTPVVRCPWGSKQSIFNLKTMFPLLRRCDECLAGLGVSLPLHGHLFYGGLRPFQQQLRGPDPEPLSPVCPFHPPPSGRTCDCYDDHGHDFDF